MCQQVSTVHENNSKVSSSFYRDRTTISNHDGDIKLNSPSDCDARRAGRKKRKETWCGETAAVEIFMQIICGEMVQNILFFSHTSPA